MAEIQHNGAAQARHPSNGQLSSTAPETDDRDPVTAVEEEVGELETMTELMRSFMAHTLCGEEDAAQEWSTGVWYFADRLEDHVKRLKACVQALPVKPPAA